MLSGGKLRTPQAIAKRRKARLIAAGIGLLAVVIVTLLTSWFMRLSFFQITNVEIEGAQIIESSLVVDFVLRELEGTHAAGFIPRSNTFFYPRRSLEASLVHEFPRIQVVELERAGPKTVRVSLEERKPFALWCGDIVPSQADIASGTDLRCYFMDETGYLFAQSPGFSGTPYFRFFGAVERGRVIGQPFLQSEEFTRAHDFLQMLADIDLDIYGLLILDDIDLEVYLTTGTRLHVRRDDDLPRVVERIATLFATDELPEDLQSIEYVDLRFGRKIYVRPFELELPTPQSAPTTRTLEQPVAEPAVTPQSDDPATADEIGVAATDLEE